MVSRLRRRSDWPERLADYLARPHRFDWATHNCALFAAGAVEAMTGEDLARRYRGPKTMRGCYGRLRRLAGGLDGAVTRALGDAIPVRYARRGDVVLVEVEGLTALGVCAGSEIAALGPAGMVMLPLCAGARAWRV